MDMNNVNNALRYFSNSCPPLSPKMPLWMLKVGKGERFRFCRYFGHLRAPENSLWRFFIFFIFKLFRPLKRLTNLSH